MTEQKITFDKFIRGALIVLAVVAAVYITNYLSGVLLPFFIAWFVAYLLYPIVKFVQYRMRVKVRALAILITLIVMIAVVSGVIYLIIPPMIEQFQRLQHVVQNYINQTSEANNIAEWVRTWLQNNHNTIENIFKSNQFSETVKNAMPRIFSLIGQTASIIISIIASFITLLYMFFILLDYEYLTSSWIKIFPIKHRHFWKELTGDVKRELNNYIRGQGLVSLCMGIMFCIGFTIIDFPMAIGLGILVGILNLVPYLHVFALIPTALLALLKAADTGQNFWIIFGLALLVFIVVQIISDMLVTPKIMGKAMGLNPAVLLLSLSVWGSLLGFIGVIIALPLTTLIIAYWQRYVTKELPENN